MDEKMFDKPEIDGRRENRHDRERGGGGEDKGAAELSWLTALPLSLSALLPVPDVLPLCPPARYEHVGKAWCIKGERKRKGGG